MEFSAPALKGCPVGYRRRRAHKASVAARGSHSAHLSFSALGPPSCPSPSLFTLGPYPGLAASAPLIFSDPGSLLSSFVPLYLPLWGTLQKALGISVWSGVSGAKGGSKVKLRGVQPIF